MYLQGTEKLPEDRTVWATPFYIGEGVLYHETNVDGYFAELLELPPLMHRDICQAIHNVKAGLSHLNFKKTYNTFLERFFRKGIAKSIRA